MPAGPRSPTFVHNFVAIHVFAVELVAGRLQRQFVQSRVLKHVLAHAPLDSAGVAGLDAQRAPDPVFTGWSNRLVIDNGGNC